MHANAMLKAVGLIVLSAVGIAGPGCQKAESAAPTASPTAKAAAEQPAKTAAAPTEATKAAKVAKVVFVGQKDCCQCTGDRILASWTALEEVLAKHQGVEVERFDIDVDDARATELEKLGKVMVIPGLYFLSADGKLVKLLQGEVTAAQVEEVL